LAGFLRYTFRKIISPRTEPCGSPCCTSSHLEKYPFELLCAFITATVCVYRAVLSTFYVLPTQCIYVFSVDLRTNSDYFTVQHWQTGFYNWDGVCLLRGTFYILRSAHTVYLRVLCGSQNKQRLFHCTALTGWFYNKDEECLLWSANWISKYKSG
jgi:hypothetical protein